MGGSSFFSGWAVDRLGLRKTLVIASLTTVVAQVMLSQARAIWLIYLWYGVFSGIARAGYTTPLMVTVTMWFKKKQGMAVGIVSSGLAVGPLILAPTFQYLIDTFGWAKAFLIMGIGSGVLLAPCCWLVRSKPADIGLKPYGEDEPAASAKAKAKPKPAHPPIFFRSDVPDFFKYAMHTSPFILMPLIHMAGCISHAIPLTQMVVMATDKGVNPLAAASVLGIANGVSVAARFGAPIVAEKIGGRKALMIFITLQAAAILWLLPARDVWLFYTFAIFFGLGYGGEMTPFPVLSRQFYGTAPIGRVYGFQSMLAQFGMGIGGFLGGFLYDIFGNYSVAILTATGMGLVAVVLAYLLVDPFKPGKRMPAGTTVAGA